MEIDTNRIRELLDKRDELDAELASLFTGAKERKPQSCGSCGETGHSSRTCSKKLSLPERVAAQK